MVRVSEGARSPLMDSSRPSKLPLQAMQQIAENTLRLRAPAGIENARHNLAYIQRSVLDLRADLDVIGRTAVVVAAGPSLRRQKIIPRLKALPTRPLVVCCDGALATCLRDGVVPDVVVSVDPDPHRIVRWFGDPKLNERPEDDYFRRQDLDVEFRENEQSLNQEVIELVNRYGPRIRAALSTSAAPDVTQRCVESGMRVFWWNPLYDDWTQAESYTRKAFELTGGIPCMTGLGHCGGAAWVLAHAALGCKRIAIVGMDLGYPVGTSVVNTQYFEYVRHLPLEQAEQFLLRIENPHTGEAYLTDPVYYWYRESFLDAARQTDSVTVNCSEEGVLFGDGVRWARLEQFAEDVG